MRTKLSPILFGMVLLLLFSSCTTLHKSQVSLIGNYYSTLAEYPGNIKKLDEQAADIALEAGNIESALYESDSVRINELVDAIGVYSEDIVLPDSIRTEIDQIEQYIRGYYVLVPNGFSIYRALKGTSESIGSFFGVRPVVSTVLPEREEISERKKQKIAKHFKSQSQQFRHSLKVIKSYVDNHLIPQVDDSNAEMKQNIQRLFNENDVRISSLNYYFDYNKYFADLFQKAIKTKKLYVSISNAIDLLLETETEIQKMTKDRGKLNTGSERLHKLVAETQRIKILIEETKLK